MEIRTTLKDFPEKMKYYHFPPETYLRVIIDTDIKMKNRAGKNEALPFITPKEQRHLLNVIPGEYCPEASQELVKIIEQSRMKY
jgi:hypothetical protein